MAVDARDGMWMILPPFPFKTRTFVELLWRKIDIQKQPTANRPTTNAADRGSSGGFAAAVDTVILRYDRHTKCFPLAWNCSLAVAAGREVIAAVRLSGSPDSLTKIPPLLKVVPGRVTG